MLVLMWLELCLSCPQAVAQVNDACYRGAPTTVESESAGTLSHAWTMHGSFLLVLTGIQTQVHRSRAYSHCG